MTDKTDIAAMQRPTRKHYDWSKAVWKDCDHCGEPNTGTVPIDDGSRICANCCDAEYYGAWESLAEQAIKLLESERQRADYGQQVINQRNAECDRLINEIAALKCQQVPVAWTDAEELRGMEKDGCGYLFKVDPANPFTDPRRQIMLFDRPQKTIISKEKFCDWLEDNFDIDDSQRNAFADCFANCCDCIVQSDFVLGDSK